MRQVLRRVAGRNEAPGWAENCGLPHLRPRGRGFRQDLQQQFRFDLL